MTPFQNPSSPAQKQFNKSHSSLRMTIEREFGILKRRFPALRFGIRLKRIEDCCILILAAFVLHNVCNSLNDEFEDLDDLPDDTEMDEIESDDEEEDQTGPQIRNYLCSLFE